jgi:RNA polymerase sigma factor (sigma-70 family)
LTRSGGGILVGQHLTPEQQELMHNNYGLVYKLYSQWEITTKNILKSDVLYDACIDSLLRAVSYYNPEKGRFSTIMFSIGRKVMLNYIRDVESNKRVLSIKADSLDRKITDTKNEETYFNFFPHIDEYDFIEDEVNNELINFALSVLNQKELDIIREYYFNPEKQTQVQIAEKLNVSQSHVARTHTKALNKMHDKLMEKEEDLDGLCIFN